MASLLGINSLQFIPNPDFDARQSENGGWTASQTFSYRGADLDNYAFRNHFSSGTKATALDPSLPDWFGFLRLVTVDIRIVEAGLAEIVVNYSGIRDNEASFGEGDSTKITYSLSGTISQRSITEHNKVKALDAVERAKLGMLLTGDIYYDVNEERYRQETTDQPFGDTVEFAAGDSSTFAQLIRESITTYDEATFVWTEYRESEEGLTNAKLNNLNKVDVPDGNPPKAGGTRDWKLISATQDFDGSLYRITRQWELSGIGGWNTDIY